jgi:hypothetical protein
MRITKKHLEWLAGIASVEIGQEITLCNAPHYGGWAVEIKNGSRRIMARKSAQACEAFLEGLIYGAGKI